MNGIVSAPHGFCQQCDRALTRIEARDRSHKCEPHPLAEVKAFQKRERAKHKAGRKKHPAAALAASAAKSIDLFDRACTRAERTDPGDAWDLLYTLRATLKEIEAQLG